MTGMNRRKFLGLGVLSSVAATVGGESSVDDRSDEELPRFEEGGLLTSAQLNRMVDEINDLKKKGKSR